MTRIRTCFVIFSSSSSAEKKHRILLVLTPWVWHSQFPRGRHLLHQPCCSVVEFLLPHSGDGCLTYILPASLRGDLVQDQGFSGTENFTKHNAPVEASMSTHLLGLGRLSHRRFSVRSYAISLSGCWLASAASFLARFHANGLPLWRAFLVVARRTTADLLLLRLAGSRSLATVHRSETVEPAIFQPRTCSVLVGRLIHMMS